MKPFKQLSVKRIRLNRYRTMLKIRYRLPNRRTADFYVNDVGRIACALVMTKDKKIVLARQFRPGPNRMMNELPGGSVEPTETPRQGIIREVREEVGYHGQVRLIGKSNNDSYSRKIRYHYVITDAVPVGRLQGDDYELIEVRLFTLRQFRQALQAGTMTDSETAYRALEYLGLLS